MDPAEQLITVARYRDLSAALLAQAQMQAAGIPCALADENLVRADWFLSNAVGGVRLQVGASDAGAAQEILGEAIPHEFEWEGEGNETYVQPRCPRCGSLDITFRSLDGWWTFLPIFLLGFGVPVKHERWVCYTCDAQWVDE